VHMIGISSLCINNGMTKRYDEAVLPVISALHNILENGRMKLL